MILNRKAEQGIIPSAFINYDASPRKGYRSTIFKGFTPDKFKYYFKKMVKKTKDEYHLDILFLMAWNEWGEGAYAEPDERYGYRVLEGIKAGLEENGFNASFTGSVDSYWGKNKKHSKEARIQRITAILGAAFIILAALLSSKWVG